jgi:hypothetical protein
LGSSAPKNRQICSSAPVEAEASTLIATGKGVETCEGWRGAAGRPPAQALVTMAPTSIS